MSAKAVVVVTDGDTDRPLDVQDFTAGTDGTSPPTLPGGATGVRGWLRLLYQTLTGTLSVGGEVALDQGTIDALGTATPGLTDDELRAAPVGVDIAPLTVLSRIGADITPDTDTLVASAGGRLKIGLSHAGDDGRIWIGVGQAAVEGVGDYLDRGDVWAEFTQAAVHVLLVDATVAQRVTGVEWAT